MLRLTRRTEYSLIALRHIALETSGDLTTAAELARRYDLPRELLAKAVQHMARLGYLEPVQGPKGGYQLKVDLSQISMMDFLTAMEGPVALVACVDEGECALFETCIIKSPIQQLNRKMRLFLESVSLAEITGKGQIAAGITMNPNNSQTQIQSPETTR